MAHTCTARAASRTKSLIATCAYNSAALTALRPDRRSRCGRDSSSSVSDFPPTRLKFPHASSPARIAAAPRPSQPDPSRGSAPPAPVCTYEAHGIVDVSFKAHPWDYRMTTRSVFFLRAACCPLAACLLAGSPGRADEFVQRPPHEHGRVTINAALEGNELVIEFDSPAVNVVGFEHAPRTDDERAAVQAAATLLHNGRGLFGMPPEARCQFEKTDLKAPQWEQGQQDEHEHHADYEARFTYRCGSPGQLEWLQPTLLDKLRNVTEARVNIAAANGQRSEVVTNGHAHVELR